MTKLNPTNLFAVEVPMDANNYITYLSTHGIWYYSKISTSYSGLAFHKFDKSIGEYKILGEATKHEITFDPESYVERYTNEHNQRKFIDYKKKTVLFEKYVYYSEQDSFRSLLQSNVLKFKDGFKYVILKPI